MTLRPNLLLPLLLAGFCLDCGGGNAGSGVRPNDPTAAGALGEPASSGSSGSSAPTGGSTTPDAAPGNCSSVPDSAEPLIVDWSSKDQVDLSVAMADKIALVNFGCKSIRFLRNCTAKGKYAFTAVPSLIEEAVKIQDADEAKASLPFSGGKLGAGLARGSAIDIALAYVGKRSAADDGVSKSDLTGSECAQATHFVRRATIGAFVMQTGTRGQVQAAAELFGVGASGASSSTKGRLSSAGNVAACKSITDGAAKAPEGCAAILRLELQAIADQPPTANPKAALPNVCPDGFVTTVAGACVKKENAASFRCDMTDPQECKDQCKKGNADSCFNAGTIAEGSEPNPVAAALYKKACDGNVGRGCYLGGRMASESLNDWPGAERLWRRGCSLGSADSCVMLAMNIGSSPIKGTAPDRIAFFRKACDLGMWRHPGFGRGCNDAVEMLFNGVKGSGGDADVAPRPEEAIKILDTWCDAGTPDACFEVRNIYKWGLLTSQDAVSSPDKPKFRQDAGKATTYQNKYCATRGHDDSRCKK